MLALVLDGALRVPRVATDHPVPAHGPGEALVRVRVSGVCDTDLQLARGYMGFSGVPGHELVGEVVACGDATWIGARVVADINAGCGACADCARPTGGGHHCPKRTVLGIAGRGGSLAELVAIPERCLVAVPDGVDDDRAVFAEPLAAALHVVDELDHRPARAIVLGDGKLGQLIARALVSASIPTTLVGRHAHKLAIAASARIETFLESELPRSARGAELVVEATGGEAGLARAIELVAPRGTIVLKTTVAAKLTVDLAPLVVNEVRLVGSRCGDMRRAVDVLASGAVDPLPLVEARYPLAQADRALAHAARRGAMKILVDARSCRGRAAS
jgi:threonine dehydrogenase-like Zn-dependent dehydrogenase